MSQQKTALPAHALALREEIAKDRMKPIRRLHADNTAVDVCQGADSVWVLVRREGGGGFALRAVHTPGAPLRVEAAEDGQGRHHLTVNSPLGVHHVMLEIPDPHRPMLRCMTKLTPSVDLLLPPGPRDLYPLDADGDPGDTEGVVRAAQRGLNTAALFLTMSRTHFGSLLYFQNLTALNSYFVATGTTPDGVVGGHWPDLGYLMPVSEEKPLPQGEEVTLSDVLLHWSPEVPSDPRAASRLFLDLTAGIYGLIERPAPEYHDWPRMARQTIRDIERSPDVTVHQYGNLYLHPYTAAEYPDSMVQLTVLMPMREFAAWQREPIPLTDALRKGVKHFFDPDLGVIRRYLPTVGSDKDADAVDSWYLYHPMANLGRLALEGDDAEARELFLRSVEFGIKVGRHFRYHWPVMYKMSTLEVITGPRKPGDPGQSDVGGLFAYVMCQAWEMTGEDRYLEEAKRAIDALKEMEFELEYQANITTWGACGCLRLWQITGDEFYRDQSYVFLASYFHNSLFWESDIANARHYPIFLGATCLHDGPYMACYECYETYAAFHEYLMRGGNELPESVRLLLAEVCKYTPSRAWYYYPSELPKEALATEVRNGHIDRKLALPLEDLYADGQPAGQVGQEVYGAGAAFTFSVRSYHHLERTPFLLFCDYPVDWIEQPEDGLVRFAVRGAPALTCRARLIPEGRKVLPAITVRLGQEQTPGRMTEEGHCEFDVIPGVPVEMRWEAGA